MNTFKTLVPAAVLFAALLFAAPGHAQDVVTVATVSGNGIVDVPVYIRDTSGTPLGLDAPAGSHIQAYAIKVNYAPAADVQSITFTRAGITTSLTPSVESSPSSPGSVSLLDIFFNESTNPIPFTSNAALPGNQIGHLTVTLAPAVTPGTVITLTLDPALTELTDQGGTTFERVGNSNLTLVNGQITATVPSVPALSPWMIALLAAGLAAASLRVRMRGDA